ncbi:tRNA (guanosine(46)-N7)-methyltransferase TrmB, partial [Mesorhizobium sp. M8A.F.Ca.ET.202.01.1.1]
MTPVDAKDRPSRATEGFFGRRHGKTIRPQQAIALESGLRAYRLDLTAQAPADLKTLFKAEVSALQLEIGFGGGEHLLHRAKEAPETGFIGVEP